MIQWIRKDDPAFLECIEGTVRPTIPFATALLLADLIEEAYKAGFLDRVANDSLDRVNLLVVRDSIRDCAKKKYDKEKRRIEAYDLYKYNKRVDSSLEEGYQQKIRPRQDLLSELSKPEPDVNGNPGEEDKHDTDDREVSDH